ncbi:MAG TPA: phage minor head protein [Gemmatimonadaceae bacterium]|nr:phage minor head protein [Gemmatimonadaceae bacterium]
MTNGVVNGRNPRSTALDITGRINRVTGRREGGIVGLTSQQMEYVANMRAELADPETASGYFSRKRRDRRFDRTVAKAIREGRPVAAAAIEKAAGRYADRLLALRGEMIARTETLTALNASNYESLLQTIDGGVVRIDQVQREWRTSMDGRVRDSHTRMNRERRGLYERFSNGLMYPGDPSGSAAQRINCRCSALPRIKFTP